MTASGRILSATLLPDGPDDMSGVRLEVLGRTDMDDPATEFHALVDALVDRERTRRWTALVDAASRAEDVVHCHFSGFATVLPGQGEPTPRYHVRTFFVAPDISAVTP